MIYIYAGLIDRRGRCCRRGHNLRSVHTKALYRRVHVLGERGIPSEGLGGLLRRTHQPFIQPRNPQEFQADEPSDRPSGDICANAYGNARLPPGVKAIAKMAACVYSGHCKAKKMSSTSRITGCAVFTASGLTRFQNPLPPSFLERHASPTLKLETSRRHPKSQSVGTICTQTLKNAVFRPNLLQSFCFFFNRVRLSLNLSCRASLLALYKGIASLGQNILGQSHMLPTKRDGPINVVKPITIGKKE